MICSGISLPFQTFYHHFATLKDSQRFSFRLSTIAPSFKLFSKSFFPIFYHSNTVDATTQDLPHALWKTWVVMVCHMILSIRGEREARWNTTYPTSKLEKSAFAAICSRLIGCKRPLQQVATRGLWSKCMVAQWPQVAALAVEAIAAICSLLQPLEWRQVAASGRKWSQAVASGRKWPQEAAGRKGLWGKCMAATRSRSLPAKPTSTPRATARGVLIMDVLMLVCQSHPLILIEWICLLPPFQNQSLCFSGWVAET